MKDNAPISKGKIMLNLKEATMFSFDFRVRSLETLQLENAILRKIIIELKSDWLAPKFDHIWKEQIALHIEDDEDMDDL